MIVVLGGSGHIGTEIIQCLERRSIPHHSLSRRECNYYQSAQLDQYVREHRPEFLINAAGFVGKPNVDACELQKADCLLSNAVLPGIIRDVCEKHRLPWGHLSSGCIYDGSGPQASGFRETDEPNFTFRTNNCSFYSGSKALGEEILAGAEQCFIWRLRMLFGNDDRPQNYLSKLIHYPKLLDVRNSLSQLDEIVAACVDCWSEKVPFGTYNLVNSGSIKTREVVELIKASGVCRKPFEFFASTGEFRSLVGGAPRSNCVLDNSKSTLAGLKLSHVADAIERSLRDWRPR